MNTASLINGLSGSEINMIGDPKQTLCDFVRRPSVCRHMPPLSALPFPRHPHSLLPFLFRLPQVKVLKGVVVVGFVSTIHSLN